MSKDTLSIIQKAFAVNMNRNSYGTIAEIVSERKPPFSVPSSGQPATFFITGNKTSGIFAS